MSARFRFHFIVSHFKERVRQLFGVFQSARRIKIIIRQFDIGIVKPVLLGHYVIDGGPAITYQFFKTDEPLHGTYYGLNFGLAHQPLPFARIDFINRRLYDFQFPVFYLFRIHPLS